uniref:Uncharacterized protein n=1 Tax=Panagrolaimus davidi TaxID=227884 RepID=A0A914QJB1_9BILA
MLLRLLLIFGFICFCYGLECNVVSGRTKPSCNCHVYENGSFTFECPENLSKSTYLEELDDLEEALTIKFPGNNCNVLPKECKCEGETFETISIECPPSAFYDVIESIRGFYMYDLQFICTNEEKMPKRITQFPKFWTRSIGFIGCGIEEFGDDTLWNIRGLLFVTLSHNKLKKIVDILKTDIDIRYVTSMMTLLHFSINRL